MSDETNGRMPKMISLTYDDVGNVRLQSTPDATLGDFVMGAWLLDRHAAQLADENTPPPPPRIATPPRPRLHIPGRES